MLNLSTPLKAALLKATLRALWGALSLTGSRVRFFAVFGLVFLTFLFLPYHTLAESGHILIVSIQIAGQNAADDFIKLYNPTNEDILLGNYGASYLRLVKRTKNSTKDYSIKSWSKDTTAKIPTKGFFLWASSKNTAFPDTVFADSRTSQTLSQDNGVALRVGPENTGQIIDAVGWGDFNNILFETASFAQNPAAEQILSRKENNDIFQDTDNNQNDFFLPLKNNSVNIVDLNVSSTEPQTKSQQLLPDESSVVSPATKSLNYPDGIIFSEILPAPKGPDDIEEWVELFNKNDFSVNLSGWKIKDSAGAIKTYILPENSKINGKGYFVIKRPDSKITLNNDGDTLELIKPDDLIADKINFGKSESGSSFNLTISGWQWSNTLTPGAANIIQSAIEKAGGKANDNIPNNESKNILASANQPFENVNKIPLLIFVFALFLALISGAAILFLKRKVAKRAFEN